MSNKGLLIIVIVLLVGIGALLLVANNRQNDTIGGQIDEAIEEVVDEVDDNT